MRKHIASNTYHCFIDILQRFWLQISNLLCGTLFFGSVNSKSTCSGYFQKKFFSIFWTISIFSETKLIYKIKTGFSENLKRNITIFTLIWTKNSFTCILLRIWSKTANYTATSLDRKSHYFSKNKVLPKTLVRMLEKYPPKQNSFTG